MNIKEMGALCEEAGMYDTSFGIRDLVAAFVKGGSPTSSS